MKRRSRVLQLESELKREQAECKRRLALLQRVHGELDAENRRLRDLSNQWRDFAVAFRKIIKGAKLVTYGNSPVDQVLSEFDRLMEQPLCAANPAPDQLTSPTSGRESTATE